MKGDRTTMSSIAGELITERLEYDGGRQVTVYVPPAPAEAVVFAGDGQLISKWSASLEAADAEVVMTERIGSHGDTFWQEELPLMVAWAFGR
jgi:hypothetical protein